VLAPFLLTVFLVAADLASTQQREPLERPGPRAHHWLVYDEGLRSVLLCGGSTAAGDDVVFYDDVWSFDGAAWTRVGALVRPESGLRAVTRPGGGIVAFGGFRANGRAVGQLREWDGEAWTTLDAASDKAVAEGGLTFDPARERFVLFGGSGSGGHRGNTWEWDGAAWHAFDVPGPAARSTHGMVHDTRRGRTVLFGGTNGSRLGDTWEWDGSAWTEVPGPGPSARLAPGMAYDAARGCTVLFGGGGAGGGLGDTWIHDGVRWRELRIPGPSPRLSPAMAFDAARGVIVLFGGRRAWPNDLADTWVFDGNEWKEVAAR
jgi:hypothetical protein